MNAAFIQKCINETLHGLREGLTHFSGSSTAAVIFCLRDDPYLSIYDPDNLLRGHEPKLESFYFGEKALRTALDIAETQAATAPLKPFPNCKLMAYCLLEAALPQFHTRCGLPNITRTFPQQDQRRDGSSMPFFAFPMMLLMIKTFIPVFPAAFCENTPLTQFTTI